MNIVANYIKESYDELVHKVSWPTRSELTSSAIVVLVASVIIALVVFSIDKTIELLMRDFIYRLLF
jgi:preprotein translocase subunit SecE